MKISIPQLIPQEFCLSCRGCCRFSRQESVWQPHLLQEEVQELGKIPIILEPGRDNFVCANLSSPDNKCLIYAKRPFECRLYPFLFDRRRSRVFLALDLNCAFVRENSKDPKWEEFTRGLIEFARSRECLDILKNNPGLAQEYPGVLDLVELKV